MLPDGMTLSEVGTLRFSSGRTHTLRVWVHRHPKGLRGCYLDTEAADVFGTLSIISHFDPNSREVLADSNVGLRSLLA